MATAPEVSVAEAKPRLDLKPSVCPQRIANMILLANPHGNHVIHLALLGSFLVFNFLTFVICAAFINEGRHWYIGAQLCIWEACPLLMYNTMAQDTTSTHLA
jgi:hypothetical protein